MEDTAAQLEVQQSQLGPLVRSWRERLDPGSIAALSAAGRPKLGVSQEDLARLIGVSTGWYRKLERGENAGYSEDFLHRVSSVLRLKPDERTLLYLLAVGREPPPSPVPSNVEVTEPLRRFVDTQEYPAYISDGSWDVVTFNQHMARWFPWMSTGPERNIMRWVFTYPEAREQLHDWEHDWAPLMLAQMFTAHARHPDNARLSCVIQEILQVNDLARSHWQQLSTVYVHPDGDRRKIHLPYQSEAIPIELLALAPLRAPDVRVMVLVPLDANRAPSS